VDDAESVRAIRRAVELGVTLFDTANVYGAGHSERVLARALHGRRDQVVIATKFGNVPDERTRELARYDATPDGMRQQLAGSLRRLGTDRVDLYQLHLGELPVAQALDLVPALDELVKLGDIRAYGWSTDQPDRATAFALASHAVTAIQHDFSVLRDAHEGLAVCERFDLASINRVSGFLARIESVREVLRSGGRTLAQGAIAYLWGRSDKTIPIPGCRTLAQVEENAGALAFGPLTTDEVAEVDKLLGRPV